jgi:aspartate aminotransferase
VAACALTSPSPPRLARRYWHAASRSLDFDGMLRCLGDAPDGSSVLLHAVAHNPTGMDPTQEQWKAIVELVTRKRFVVILDNAYQGFASGSLETDRYSTKLLDAAGAEFFLCQSFAKNMGMYGERIGMLHVVTSAPSAATCVLSQLKLVVRPMYSSPPIHGAELVIRLLGEASRREAWEAELATTAKRILSMRGRLVDGLVAKGTPGTWDHITTQIGMFSFTGLSPEQCELLISKYAREP